MSVSKSVEKFYRKSDLPLFCLERSKVTLFRLFKSKKTTVIERDELIALLSSDYDGKGIDSLFVYYPVYGINIELLEEVLKSYASKERRIVLRNVPSATLVGHTFEFHNLLNTQSFTNPLLDLYPDENTFPQTIYKLPEIKGTNITTVAMAEGFEFQLLLGSKHRRYRETVYRIVRKYKTAKCYTSASSGFFDKVSDTWLDFMLSRLTNNNNILQGRTYNQNNFMLYWYEPMKSSIDLAFNSVGVQFVKRGIEFENELGGWIGSVEKETLFCHVIIHSKKNGLFGDALLLDIINYAWKIGVKQINLGGCESQYLFDYKTKFIDLFPESFFRHSNSFLCLPKS